MKQGRNKRTRSNNAQHNVLSRPKTLHLTTVHKDDAVFLEVRPTRCMEQLRDQRRTDLSIMMEVVDSLGPTTSTTISMREAVELRKLLGEAIADAVKYKARGL
jgi:hypothetical protein